MAAVEVVNMKGGGGKGGRGGGGKQVHNLLVSAALTATCAYCAKLTGLHYSASGTFCKFL